MWKEMSFKIEDFFNSISILDLCSRAKEIGVEREYDHPYTYQI
jgi:hypothetical protein